MKAKEQVPLVLWTDALTNMDSFPVILVDTNTDSMDIDYTALLRVRPKQEPETENVVTPVSVRELAVEEISADEFNKYFGHLNVSNG